MKKLTIAALLGITIGFAYLVLQKVPRPIKSPKISHGTAVTSHLNFIISQPPMGNQSGKINRRTVRHDHKSRPDQVIATSRRIESKQNAQAEGAFFNEPSSPAIRESVAIRRNFVPRANDGKWVSHLSGQNVDLSIRRQDLSGPDCRNQICPEKSKSYTLAGIVVEPRRLVSKKADMIDRIVANGDGQLHPFVYIK